MLDKLGESLKNAISKIAGAIFIDQKTIDLICGELKRALLEADVDERGGTCLSVSHVTGKPILFLGMGQEYKDLEVFDKKKIVEKIFG